MSNSSKTEIDNALATVPNTTSKQQSEASSSPAENNSAAVEEKVEELSELAKKFGKLAPGYWGTKFRVGGLRIIDLNMLSEEQLLAIVNDPTMKFFIAK